MDSFTSALEDELNVARGSNITVRRSPSSSSTGPVKPLAAQLIARARLKPAADVLAELQELLAVNQAQMLQVSAIWGVHPDRRIELSDGIQLMALSDAPPSPAQEQWLGVSSRINSVDDGPPRAKPTGALVREITHGPIFNPSGNLSDPWTVANQAVPFGPMRELSRVLVLLRDSPVAPIAHWVQGSEDGLIVGGSHGGGGWEIRHPYLFATEKHSVEGANHLAQQYMGLPTVLRRKLRTPLDRLNMAMLRLDYAETALDLGIALESLLLPQKSQGELRFQFRLRGTRLLGGDQETQRANSALLREIYDARSQAAHGALFEDPDDDEVYDRREREIEKVTKPGFRLAGELLRSVIQLGREPDWESVAFGWGA